MLNIQSAEAAKSGSPPGAHLTINEVFFVEGDPDTLVISGKDFNFGEGALVVTFGNVGELNILSDSATEIEVEIPDVPAGDYLIKVFREGGQSQGDKYDMTIGAVGPAGPQGPAGPAGVVLGFYTRTSAFTMPSGVGLRQGVATASCDPGDVVVGGGHSINLIFTTFQIAASEPVGTTGWTIRFFIEGYQGYGIRAVAQCADVTP